MQVSAVKAWKRAWMPETPSRASLVLLHQVHFADALLKVATTKHTHTQTHQFFHHVSLFRSFSKNVRSCLS